MLDDMDNSWISDFDMDFVHVPSTSISLINLEN